MKSATNITDLLGCICSCETQGANVHCGTEGFRAYMSVSLDNLRCHRRAQ